MTNTGTEREIIGYAAISSAGANRYYFGTVCRDCDTTLDPMYRNGVPCAAAQDHAIRTATNWQRIGHGARVRPIRRGDGYAIADGF